MSKTVSTRFLAAENSTANHLTSRVFLVSRNYANAGNGATATAYSTYSSDYPASGAIDGDRTMINMGAASSAENGLGKSSWRSAGTTPTSEYITIDFGQARTFNRIKLYQQTGHGITYAVYYWSDDYNDWCLLYSTTASTPSTTGYGNGAYGNTPYGDPPEVQTYYGVDSVDIGYDVTAQKIKIVGLTTEVSGDYLNILEVEVYRLIDISNRTLSTSIQMQQDYTLQSDMVSSGTIVVDNTDKFFSLDYSPTAAEISQGFINSELGTGLGIIVQYGYQWSGSEKEYVTAFVGNIDQYKLSANSRQATFSCRNEKGKLLVNAITTSKIKYYDSVENNFSYAVQLANIHPAECSIEKTGLYVGTFFVNNESVFSAIKELTNTLGTGRFYITSEDVPTLVWNSDLSYTLQSAIASKNQFDAGTLTKVSSDTIIDSLTQGTNIGSFLWGDYSPEWTLVSNSNSKVEFDGDNNLLKISQIDTGLVYGLRIAKTSTAAYGVWILTFDATAAWSSSASANAGSVLEFDFIIDSSGNSGYGLIFYPSTSTNYLYRVKLVRWDSGVETVLGSQSITNLPGYIAIERTSAGVFKLYQTGGGSTTLGTDTTYTTSATMNIYAHYDTIDSSVSNPYISIGKMLYMDNTSVMTSTFESVPICAGDNFSAWSTFTASSVLHSSFGSISYYFATSSDGETWSSWYSIPSGSVPTSATGPYIKFKATWPTIPALGYYPPILSGLNIAWTVAKTLPTPDTITINDYDSMLDFNIEYTDVLAGDSAVYNYIKLTDSNYTTDSAWSTLWNLTLDGTTTKVDSEHPYLISAAGTYTFTPTLSSPAVVESLKAFIEADSALGATVSVIYQHSLNPIIQVVCTGTGYIYNLEIRGRAITQNDVYTATTSDSTSLAKYGKREYDTSTKFGLTWWTASLAALLLARYKNMVAYVNSLKTTTIFRAELSDQVTWYERNATSSSQTYKIIGITHSVSNHLGI